MFAFAGVLADDARQASIGPPFLGVGRLMIFTIRVPRRVRFRNALFLPMGIAQVSTDPAQDVISIDVHVFQFFDGLVVVAIHGYTMFGSLRMLDYRNRLFYPQAAAMVTFLYGHQDH